MQWRTAGVSQNSSLQHLADHGGPASEQHAAQAPIASGHGVNGKQQHRQAPPSQSAAAPSLEAGASAAGLGSLHGVSLALTSSSFKAASHTTIPDGIGTGNAPVSEGHQDKRQKTSESDGSGCDGLDAAIRAISAGNGLNLSGHNGILEGCSLDIQRPNHKIAQESSQREVCNRSDGAVSADNRRSEPCQGAADVSSNAQQPSQDTALGSNAQSTPALSDSMAQAAESRQL